MRLQKKSEGDPSQLAAMLAETAELSRGARRIVEQVFWRSRDRAPHGAAPILSLHGSSRLTR